MKLQQDKKKLEYHAIRRVSLVGAALDLLLGVAKILFGWIGHSQSLIADGVHSLSDLFTDVVVLWAAKASEHEADSDHPYGHGRFQTAATVFLGMSLIVVAIGIGYDAISRLFNPAQLEKPAAITLWVALISVLTKEAIYHYTMRTARKLRSNLLKANAWHSRSDAMSSIVVMVGIVGTLYGLVYLDAIAAVIVAAMIIHVGWKLAWDSLCELVDTGLDDDELKKFRDIMRTVDGVTDVHELRTRHMGDDIYADVHIHVNPTISVSEGHRIGDGVEQALSNEFDNLTDVIVHIDPEDDQKKAPLSDLPLRDEMVSELTNIWEAANQTVLPDKLVLHYLAGGIQLEIKIDAKLFDTLEEAKQTGQQLCELAMQSRYVNTVEFNLRF